MKEKVRRMAKPGSEKVDLHKTVSPILLKNRVYETIDYKDLAREKNGLARLITSLRGLLYKS